MVDGIVIAGGRKALLKISARTTPTFAQLQSTLRKDFSLIRPAIYIAGNKINDLIVKTIHTEIINTWSKTPSITKKIITGMNKVEYVVTVAGDNFFFVTVGASPHIIEPRKAPMLVFPIGYTPKTKVGTLQSVHGGKDWGGAWYYGGFVQHPGLDARDLDERILKELGDRIYNILYNEIARFI